MNRVSPGVKELAGGPNLAFPSAPRSLLPMPLPFVLGVRFAARALAALTFAVLAAVPASAQPFSLVFSPNHAPGDSATFNILRGVGASGPSDAWAVGQWYDPPTDPFQAGTLKTLAMHWDGAAWTIVPTPNPAQGGNGLWDVEMVTSELGWAAGNQGGNGARPLMLKWNGSAWAVDPLPPLGSGPGSGSGLLLDMHAESAADVWAVGTAGNWGIQNPGYASFVPLAFHRTGGTWQISIPPFVTDFRHELNAVHGSSPDNVWAVGSWGETYGRYRPLVYRWDGAAWHTMPAPFDQNPFMPLHSVAVLAPDDVWVTADRFDGAAGPVTAHWDGTTWTEHLNPGGTGALIAVATDDVFGFGVNVTHWDGTAWTVFEEFPDVPGVALHASELTSDGDVWAVGRYIPEGEIQTLTLVADGLRAGTTTATVPQPPADGRTGLSAPAPSPVRDAATVTLTLDAAQPVTVAAYDVTGRRVAVLHDGPLAAGLHTLTFEAAALPAGVYVLRATGASFAATTRAVVAR